MFSKYLTSFFVSVFIVGSFFTLKVYADGMMIPINPPNVQLRESEQNAIVAWNGEEEVLILSTNAMSDKASTTVLRVFALPSKPDFVEEGSFKSFTDLKKMMNDKLARERTYMLNAVGSADSAKTTGAVPPPAEIVFQEVIGPHDIKIIKLNNVDEFLFSPYLTTELGLDLSHINNNLRNTLKNYMLRGITYFSFDKITVGTKDSSVTPLVFKFKSPYFFYPIKITASSEAAEKNVNARDSIHVFAVTTKPITDQAGVFSRRYPSWWRNKSLEFTSEELGKVTTKIQNLFPASAYITELRYTGPLNATKDDIIFYSSDLWKNNFKAGSQGSDVVALQKILINEELWNSDAAPTGNFGPITSKAVIKFQEKYSDFVLKPWGITKGTGFVGPYTRKFLGQFQMQ